ncbi:MAG TPA: hypothetical protein VE152_04720, partial [Acidimicrobiales bacterium]|nr:hypothetical protein [Acidimicrobiales bacterium]
MAEPAHRGSPAVSRNGTGRTRATLARRLGTSHQRRVWTKRATSWDHADNPALDQVVAAVMAQAAPEAGMV